MQVRNQVTTGHGATDWFQIGKGVHQGCILSSCLFNLYAVYHVKWQAGWSTSWNQDYQEKYQYLQICRWYDPYGKKWRQLESLLMKVKEKNEKVGLKLNIQGALFIPLLMSVRSSLCPLPLFNKTSTQNLLSDQAWSLVPKLNLLQRSWIQHRSL